MQHEGVISFPPHELLDERSLQLTQRIFKGGCVIGVPFSHPGTDSGTVALGGEFSPEHREIPGQRRCSHPDFLIHDEVAGAVVVMM